MPDCGQREMSVRMSRLDDGEAQLFPCTHSLAFGLWTILQRVVCLLSETPVNNHDETM